MDNSIFIGNYFKVYINQSIITRKALAKRLNFNYADNDRMICFYLQRKDCAWKQSEVKLWCEALRINEKAFIYTKLMNCAGIKDLANE